MSDAAASFADRLDGLDTPVLSAWSLAAGPRDAEAALARAAVGRADLADLAALLGPAADLGALAEAAHAARLRRFGRSVALFAPLYLSNACLSTCTYCGFAKGLPIRRRTLTTDEAAREAELLRDRGLRHLLLVSGEHAREVPPAHLAAVVARLAGLVPQVSVETQVWDTDVYADLVAAGCDGVVIYQETYDHATYAAVHVAGRKRRERFRLEGPERAAQAGVRRLGLGALLGLAADWRADVLATAAHAAHLHRRFPRVEVTVSFPRLRPSAADPDPAVVVDDRSYARLVAAVRLVLPDTGIVLSTRETAQLREGLVPLGVTTLSAGSVTEPGGYNEPDLAEPQFSVADERPPVAVAAALRAAGYDPVWKDWSPALRVPA